MIEKYFNISNYNDGKKYYSLMCLAYLSMYDVEVLEIAEDKAKLYGKTSNL